MTRVLVIGFVFLINFHVISQNLKEADSLIALLHEDLEMEERIRLFINIAYTHPDASTSLDYSRTALDLAIKHDNLLLQARAWEELGAVQRVLGNNEESLNASFNALDIYEELRRGDLQAAVLVQLGNNAVNDDDYPQANTYFNHALEHYQRTQDTIYIAVIFINIGEVFRSGKQFDSAIHYFKRALKLNDALKSPIVSSYSLGNLGMTYNALDQLEEARNALNASLELVLDLGDPYTHSVFLADLGLIDQKEQNWAAAEEGFGEALQIAKDNGLKEQIRDISKMMVNFYKLKGDFKKALSYQELFQVYQDSLVNKENVQRLERLKSNHEISRKEAEIAQLTEKDLRRKRQVFATVGITIIFVGLSMLLYRSNRAKQKANRTLTTQKEVIRTREEEKALLLKELNHRVKNNLQMISSLLNLQGNELKGHPAEAAISAGKFRVDALALIHQKLYREDVHTTIPLKDYIEELVLNLCYSFGNSVKPQFRIEPLDLSIDHSIPLALIVNELVTNSLKHAFHGVTDPDFHPELKIEMIVEGGQLVLSVKDNGLGYPEENLESDSFGLKLVKSLVTQLDAQMTRSGKPHMEWKISMPLSTFESVSKLT